MKSDRRKFIKQVTSGMAAATMAQSILPLGITRPADNATQPSPDEINKQITKVFVNFKTHWDIGYTASAQKIKHNLIYWHIPATIQTANEMRMKGIVDRLVCTFGSWAVYECLEKTKGRELSEIEHAIADDVITWNAMPFTMHCEYYDRSLFDFGLSLSKKLDERFGKKTIAAKLTDVPCHTINIIPSLAQAGVKFLHVGVNWACLSPKVPPVFVWKHPDGDDVIVMYDHHGYGSPQTYEGHNELLGLTMKGDNMDPWTLPETTYHFEKYRKTYPNALVVGGKIDDYANSLLKIKAELPVVENELGDTWIYGTASDPLKTSKFRELSRLRQKWISNRKLNINSRSYYDFSSNLALVGEHTWGLDHNTFLNDQENYETAAFQKARSNANYLFMEASWKEQRDYLDRAFDALEESLQIEALSAFKQAEPSIPETANHKTIQNTNKKIKTSSFSFNINNDGALSSLTDRKNRREWFSSEQPFGCFQYQTFDADDYKNYYKQYFIGIEEPEFKGIENSCAKSSLYQPKLERALMEETQNKISLIMFLSFPKDLTEKYGAPKKIVNTMIFDDEKREIEIILQWFDKQACRLPEALWLSFYPETSFKMGWMMDKMGNYLSPFEVIYDGNRSMHAIQDNIRYTDKNGQMVIASKDAHLLNLGKPSLLDFRKQLPKLSDGFHFNLFNNIWKTNFRGWYEENATFRFTIKFS
jgi:hypothetical protein